MISRVADHCFWLGRYLERTECTARVLFTTRNLALDGELTAAQCWHPAIIVSGEEQAFTDKHGEDAAADGELVQHTLTWDEDSGASIRRSVAAARENARSIREVVSLETWEAVNELHVWLGSDAARDEYASHRYGFYRHVRQMVQLCVGLAESSMLHDTPLEFISLGLQLERVGWTARILDVHHHALRSMERLHQVIETALWLSLLRACSGFEPFMKRNQGRVTGTAVATFLMLEPMFPRSVRFGVHSAWERLCAIRPASEPALPGQATLARLGALDCWLAGLAASPIDQDAVHDLLTHVVDEIAAVCNGVSREILGLGGDGEGDGDREGVPQ